MKLTARASAELISVSHNVGLRDAARVLTAGLAGRATKQGSALLYDEERLDLLLGRPLLPAAELDRRRPFIVRINRKHAFDIEAPWTESARAVAGPWHLPLPTSFRLAYMSTLEPPDGIRHPLVGVLADWVAVGAEITGYAGNSFRLEPPSSWFDVFQDTWLTLPPRRRWILWGTPPSRSRTDQEPSSWITASKTESQIEDRPAARPARPRAQAAYRDSLNQHADDVPVRSNGRL
ncbi:MAG: hypothetical protein ACRDPS_01600 [Nocardioides sp.]|uniref:hypothetical protein n=1 Tax=Nocardioides sp. TaxID=35761 RepID=UPI003D6BB9A7